MNKDDNTARRLWGPTYDAIPKSVFAAVAWYLADCASDAGVGNDGEIARFVEELDALAGNGILGAAQVKRVKACIERYRADQAAD